MDIRFIQKTALAKKDALVFPLFEGEKPPSFFSGPFSTTLKQDLFVKKNQIVALYDLDKNDKRVLFLNLGKKKEYDPEEIRRSFGALTKECRRRKITSIALFMHEEEHYPYALEGIYLANYAFTNYKSDQQKHLLQEVDLIDVKKPFPDLLNKMKALFEGVYLARDLVNTPARDCTPEELKKEALSLAKGGDIVVKVLGKKELEKEKMGLLLAVNQGADQDPYLITLSYKGAPKEKSSHVLIGKGVTFDTGGINLKPASGGSLEIMKKDMAGAACCLGVMRALQKIKPKINVTAVIPAVENSLGSKSYHPGDVIRASNGLSVEIGNTDAEGRLILADAICYARKYLDPKEIIDVATLTGAVLIALGSEAAGLFTNDTDLEKKLLKASERTSERAHPFPLYKDYEKQLDSDIADMNNVGGREAGSITAALFLKKFVENTPWAHLDIAGVSWDKEGRRYFPKHATGYGVRLLTDYLLHEKD